MIHGQGLEDMHKAKVQRCAPPQVEWVTAKQARSLLKTDPHVIGTAQVSYWGRVHQLLHQLRCDDPTSQARQRHRDAIV